MLFINDGGNTKLMEATSLFLKTCFVLYTTISVVKIREYQMQL